MLWGKECRVHIGACFSGGSRLAPAGSREGGRKERKEGGKAWMSVKRRGRHPHTTHTHTQELIRATQQPHAHAGTGQPAAQCAAQQACPHRSFP